MKIAIVGSGSVGTYYGAKLAHGGNDVHFLMRGDLSEIRRDGIFVRGKGENFRVAKVNCYNSTQEIGPCDLAIVALKATSTADLVDLVPPLLKESTMLLTLQNGLGNEEFLAEHFGAERVLGGLCFIAVDRHSKSEVERYAYGHVVLGEFNRVSQPRTREVAAEFSWNIPFNGLSIVAGRIDTATIVADKNLRQLTISLMNEVITAANKCGYALPNDAWQEHIKRSETMSGYKPSTLQDWEAGKPLEIEAIWGEPVRRAAACSGKMPLTETIYLLLNKIDRRRGSP